jgi:hypothetical protein
MYLKEIAHARSGDKGAHANIGVIANSLKDYQFLESVLTESRVFDYFKNLGVTSVKRYELPNLMAFNFVLRDILDGGGSLSLRSDAQGKALAQALLKMDIGSYASES